MKAASDNLSLILRAVADPTRRKILRLLRASKPAATGQPKGLTASDLQQKTKMAQPTISHHMRVLTSVSLVAQERKGTWVWYTANKKALGELPKAIASEL